MVAEIYGGITAAKAAFDIAKGLKDIHDATLRNAAVIDLQEKILATQQEQMALIDRIRELEKEVASFETWETEKQKYELKDLGYGSFVLMLKPEARGTEPAHWVCTNCYSKGQISVIVWGAAKPGARPTNHCPACGNETRPTDKAYENGTIRWLDEGSEHAAKTQPAA